jgi:PPM family protein phosphatase
MPLHLIARGACITNQGPVKNVNEDACLVDRVVSMTSLEQGVPFEISPLRTLVVADGIGGQHAGEEASRYLIASLAQREDLSYAGLYHWLCQMNQNLFEMANADRNLRWMGATIAGLAVTEQGLMAFNVGDARVYQMVENSLLQLTTDDSLEELLKHIDPSELPPDLPQGIHVLVQSVGGAPEQVELEPHFFNLSTPTGRFVLCTDGLSSVVPHNIIESIVRETKATSECVNALFMESMATGGMDDVTIVVIDVTAE